MTSAEVLLLYTGGLGPKAPEAVDGLEGNGGGATEAGWILLLTGLIRETSEPLRSHFRL